MRRGANPMLRRPRHDGAHRMAMEAGAGKAAGVARHQLTVGGNECVTDRVDHVLLPNQEISGKRIDAIAIAEDELVERSRVPMLGETQELHIALGLVWDRAPAQPEAQGINCSLAIDG